MAWQRLMRMEEAVEKQKPHLDSARLKRFMIHLASASKKVEDRETAKDKIREHVDRLKSAVYTENASHSDIKDAVGDLDGSLKLILDEENQILASQKMETKNVTELRTRLDSLNEKLIGLGREYAEDAAAKDEEIADLKKQLVAAQSTIEEHEKDKDERRERLAVVETKIQEHHEAKKKEAIKEVAAQLKELEKTHKRLEKSGKHPKTHLNKLKKMIDSHKQTLVDMKKAK